MGKINIRDVGLILSVLLLAGCEIKTPTKKEVFNDRSEVICLDGYKQRLFYTRGGYGNAPIFDPKTSKVIPCEE